MSICFKRPSPLLINPCGVRAFTTRILPATASWISSDYEPGVSFLYDDDFVVVMEMQRRALPRLRFDKEYRNPNIPLLGTNEVVRTPNEG
jgi:hypothetical protein